MANVMGKSPFFIDTTTGATFQGKFFPARVRWVGAGDGDRCVIHRYGGSAADSEAIWESNAVGADFETETYYDDTDFWPEGFQVSVLEGGRLYIHYR